MASGHVTRRDVEKIAESIFDPDSPVSNDVAISSIVGYVLTMPRWTDLPPHVRGFVLKALLECRVTNILDDDSTVLLTDDEDNDA